VTAEIAGTAAERDIAEKGQGDFAGCGNKLLELSWPLLKVIGKRLVSRGDSGSSWRLWGMVLEALRISIVPHSNSVQQDQCVCGRELLAGSGHQDGSQPEQNFLISFSVFLTVKAPKGLGTWEPYLGEGVMATVSMNLAGPPRAM